MSAVAPALRMPSVTNLGEVVLGGRFKGVLRNVFGQGLHSCTRLLPRLDCLIPGAVMDEVLLRNLGG